MDSKVQVKEITELASLFFLVVLYLSQHYTFCDWSCTYRRKKENERWTSFHAPPLHRSSPKQPLPAVQQADSSQATTWTRWKPPALPPPHPPEHILMLRFRLFLSWCFHEHLRPSELGVVSCVLHRKTNRIRIGITTTELLLQDAPRSV